MTYFYRLFPLSVLILTGLLLTFKVYAQTPSYSECQEIQEGTINPSVSAQGGSASKTFTLTGSTNANASVVVYGLENGCGSVSVTGPNGVVYTESYEADGHMEALVLPPGTYTVTATRLNVSCPGVVVSIDLTKPPMQPPTVTWPSGTQGRCQGAGTDTYTSTTDTPPIAWSLTPSEAGTINTSGVVTWNASFTGTAKVKATSTNACGWYDFKVTDVLITPTSNPAPPVATAASSISCTSFKANWGAVSGAAGYRWDVSSSNTFTTFVPGYNNAGGFNVLTLDVLGLTPGTTYYYRLRTIAGCGIGANSPVYSVTTLAASTAPVATAATSLTATGFTANWGAVAGATSYGLEVASNSSFTTLIANYANLTTTSQTISGLSTGSTYYYRVKTNGSCGTSPVSNVISVTLGCSGDFIWGQKVGTGGGDAGYAVAVDGNGNSYVTGQFSGTLTLAGQTFTSAGGLDMLLVQYNAAGVAQWAVRAGGVGDDAGRGIIVDASGNTYLTGWISGANVAFISTGSTPTEIRNSAGGYDAFVAKYNISGTLQWVKTAGGTGEDRGIGIGLDAAGNAYITGWSSAGAAFGSFATASSLGGMDVFLAKYNNLGEEKWVSTATSAGLDQGFGVVVDAAGNSFVTGLFSNNITFSHPTTPRSLTNAGGTDIFLARYATDGTVQWVQRAGGTGADQGTGIALDASGILYVTGFFSNSTTFGTQPALISEGGTDIFLAKFNPADGVAQWARRAGGTSHDLGYSLAIDAATNLYITGYFNGQAGFGSLPVIASAGGRDLLVAKYSSAGLEQWVKTAGGTQDDRGIGIALDAGGMPLVTGDFFSTISLGTSLTSAGGNDLLLTKVCPSAPSCSAPVNLAGSALSLTAPLDFASLSQLDATALLKWNVNSVPERTAGQYSIFVQVVAESVDANGNLIPNWNSSEKKQIQLNYGSLALGAYQQLLSGLLSAPNQDTRYFWRVGLLSLAAVNGIQPIEWTDAQSFTLKGLTQPIPAAYLATSHTNNINWVYEVTYLDEGKTIQNISYVDGLGNTRQNQVLASSNTAGNKILASEVAYSEEGGGAVQSMMAPTGSDQFGYAPRFFDVKVGTVYSDFGTVHFDREVKGTTTNALRSPEPVDNTAGVGKYYSPNSPEAYVDDAGGFPYAYSVYYKDPLDRPMLGGNLGAALKITSGKEIQYFSVKASQEELARVYGTQATSRMEGIVKNVAIDPNGVGSVSYLDQEGQLIASALTGCSTTNLNLDALNEDGQTGFTQRYNGLENDALNPATYEKSSQTQLFCLLCYDRNAGLPDGSGYVLYNGYHLP